MRSPVTTPWHPAGWQARPAQQQPKYKNPAHLEQVVAQPSRLPPIVVSWEIDALTERLAAAQRGHAFLLQGGDCAETFAECESDLIAKKLKILLQMSLVLLHGLKKPIIRVGRMAGQYAKPRSADMETQERRHAAELPRRSRQPPRIHGRSPRARSGPAVARLRARVRSRSTSCARWSMAASPTCTTRNTGTLGFVNHSPLKATYERIAGNIADALDFFEGISGTRVHESMHVDFYASHEGLHLLYEQAQTRFIPRQQRWYNLSTHYPWIGMRTGAARRRACRIHARHLESDRREDRRGDGCRVAAGSSSRR